MASENLGRNLTFKIYNADGTSFHNLEMRKATYDSVVMSLSDKITGEVYYKDNTLAVTMSEYIEYNGTKFILVNPPTILREGLAKDNSELKGMTKYSFEFYHPMCKLANIPFTDVAVSNDEKRYKSQDKTFSWIGKGYDFIAKINKNIESTPWVVVPSTDGESMNKLSKLPSEILPTKAWEEKQNDVLSFDNNSIADALKVIYDSWGLPFVISPLSEGEYYNADNVDYYSEEGGSKRFVIIAGYPSNEIVDKDSEYGTVVNADTFMSGSIYYNTTPVTVPPNVKIVVESLEEDVIPVILNEMHNGVIGTTNRTFAEYTTVYIGLSRGTGRVRYSFDNSQNNVYVFRFGQGVGLKNNSRTPRNNKIVTRIAGYGSTDNIPYGYPQIVWSGSPDAKTTPDGYPIYKGIVAGHSELLIKHPFTRTHLMPSIYSETVNRKVNPYATGYNPDIEIVDYYDADSIYPNPAVADAPSYEIHEFGGIKPELGVASIVDAKPLDKDNTTVVDEWDDTLDKEGNYVQSYFKITLPPLGFDIYASAAVTQEMKINMRSGACIGCTFEVQVDWEDYKVNFYDSNAEFAPSGAQRDYQKYPDSTSSAISVTVKKEIETFGTLMPNIYQYPVSGDEFVIIGISMPLTYISNAERRLDDAMKSYMLGNNIYYYDYPLKFDEYFLSQRTDILSQIKPNSIIRFLFGDESQKLMLYVKQLTVKYGGNPLPQYDITLTDNIDVVLNSIGQVVDDVEKLGAVISELRRGDSGTGSSTSGADKLSRVSDDEAQGKILFRKGLWIKEKGLYGFDENGNIDANEGNFNGRVTTNIIRSNNYTGDGIADTGWRITNANNGHSKLTIDEIYVRMRATFESLEVKRWNVSAGDTINSCAANVINRTEYLDGSGEALGYSDIRVPWLMRGIPFLLSKFSGTAARKMYAAIRKVRVSLTQEQLSQVKTVRCYFLANDGDTEIQNWWRENDLVRCQTMNVVSTNRQTYTGTTAHTGNVMWWRKCIGVSSEPVELEQGKKYHYIDIAYDKAAEDAQSASIYCMLGSDIPAAGDHMVQFGNTVIPGRMNLWIQMVNGGGSYDYDPSSDAPCIKGFKGIYTFDLSKCWYGGNPCKMTLAPGKKYEFYGEDFRVIKEYGTVPVPTNRGLWTSITPERDDFSPHDNVRKCYYYDEVSHNGCVWRCSIADGVHWVDASGNYITDAAYEALSDAQKVTCTRKPNYTTDEPTANSSNWIKLVSRGEDGNGVEYVFIRTDSYSQPYISNSSDTYGGKTYLDDDYLPLSNYGRCTDNPTGVDQNTPYEWVAKREKSAPDSVTGKRSWEKYSGYMALFSRFSMDGDTPIAVYAWNQSKDTAPSISGNSYPPSGWSKTAPNRPGDGYFLWMSSSVQHSNGTRDNWSTPVRISGDTGSAGEDAKEREWIYRLNSSDGYNSKTTNRGKSFQDDDFAPINWNDNPSGVSSYGDSEYASFREYNHSTKSWGDFHSPIVWSHYGERGMDGDGVEYVFARTSTNTAPYVYSNPTHGGKSYTDDEYTPRISGASETYATDDPQGVTSALPYEWVAMRRKVLGSDGKTRTWPEYATGSTNGKMALWSKWSEDGNGIVSITCTFAISSVGTVASETTEPAHYGSWDANIPVMTDDYPYLWRQELTTFTDTTTTTKYYCMGCKGGAGEKGATVRGPRMWSNSSSIAYNDGSVEESDNIYYIDLVLYNSKYWRCIKAHNASSSRTPGTSSTYWVEATQFDFVATNLILANYAKINNLGADAIEMEGSNGKKFTAKAGSVYCNTGTFENVDVTGKITASEGKIGKWEITENGLKTTTGTPSINIYPDGNHFLRIENDQTGGFLKVRNDSGKAASFSAYGANSIALELIGQAGNGSKAINSTGNVAFNIRSGETAKFTTPSGNSGGTVQFDIPLTFGGTSLLQYSSGTVFLPAEPIDGQFLFLKASYVHTYHKVISNEGLTDVWIEAGSSRDLGGASIIMVFSKTLNAWIMFWGGWND